MTRRLIIKEDGYYRVLFLEGQYKSLDRAILAVKDHEQIKDVEITPWITLGKRTFIRVSW